MAVSCASCCERQESLGSTGPREWRDAAALLAVTVALLFPCAVWVRPPSPERPRELLHTPCAAALGRFEGFVDYALAVEGFDPARAHSSPGQQSAEDEEFDAYSTAVLRVYQRVEGPPPVRESAQSFCFRAVNVRSAAASAVLPPLTSAHERPRPPFPPGTLPTGSSAQHLRLRGRCRQLGRARSAL